MPGDRTRSPLLITDNQWGIVFPPTDAEGKFEEEV
jgi:hypothetical protein